ncbi:hypothetical protein GCM10022380_15390 [Amycolatopsis tucumanensis]|uniref:Uncharacterized protein n=1 Tax=Amycolatopsis tucumanensis TaxID=401106 RepID=A0ABP7HUV5_9PSEU
MAARDPVRRRENRPGLKKEEKGKTPCECPVKPWLGGRDMSESLTARMAAVGGRAATVRSFSSGSPTARRDACVTVPSGFVMRRADPVMRIGLFMSVIAGTVG